MRQIQEFHLTEMIELTRNLTAVQFKILKEKQEKLVGTELNIQISVR